MEQILGRLQKSKFRSSFHLSLKDRNYISEKGMETIAKHAQDFIEKRLAPKDIANDGKQTPFKGHPVFVAQHATGTCCRGCLYKWHHIPKGRKLTDKECLFVKSLIMNWINEEIKRTG